jgi:hypothetical protein
MALNPTLNTGNTNEQGLLEDLIIEAIRARGQEFYYIPRTLVAKDGVFGEDRLSQYKQAFPIEMYLESSMGFEGSSSFLAKFGHVIDQTAKLTVARRRWTQLIGNSGNSQLPNRPAEGDLLYFPLTTGLFVIKNVEYQDSFYQLNKLYTWKLSIELFTYSSETIATGIPEVDQVQVNKALDLNGTDVPDSFGDNAEFQNDFTNIKF